MLPEQDPLCTSPSEECGPLVNNVPLTDSQEADVQVRVLGMVFSVPTGDLASLVPEGHGGWQVCVGASRHHSPILFEDLSWEISVVGCVRLISSRSANEGTPIAATMVPTGGATTSSVRRSVARAWAR